MEGERGGGRRDTRKSYGNVVTDALGDSGFRLSFFFLFFPFLTGFSVLRKEARKHAPRDVFSTFHA